MNALLLRPTAVLVCAILLWPAFARAAPPPPPGREELRRSFEALLAQAPLSAADVGIEVVSLDNGDVAYARGESEQLNPASNTKLITSAAVLLRLGPEFRFTTEFRSDKRLPGGRVKNLYVKGGGDPSINTERLSGLVNDLWHRGVRAVQGDLILDDSYLDGESWGPGWEQEGSDKSYAAPVGALSLNHNSVGIYVWPADKRGGRARVELEPDSPYFTVESKVATVRGGGRRRVVVHTSADGERTRVAVRGRLPAARNGVVMYRRVYDPALYFGQTLRMLLAQRGIRTTGKVRKGAMPETAALVASYDSPELADIVRDMNKVSSNFIAEMLLKALGAEVKGAPGTWLKGVEVAQELLGELGVPRGSYVLKNGSGLNDTNRFSAHQLTALLSAVWKRFPVAAEFISSLGIAGRDGTLRLRMEGTEAAGRLRAKTGTLEQVTALSGFVQSVGGERFAFSILVNHWPGRASPVVHSIDLLGGALAAVGGQPLGPREAALAQLSSAGQEAGPAELRARYATYAALSQAPDKKNLPFLRSALQTERDPLLRLAAADALYQNDPDFGGPPLLEAMPLSPELFVRLRELSKELSLPLPVVSSLLDLAADGSADAMVRVLALAPLARSTPPDDLFEALSDGLEEVGHNAPDELQATLRAAPPEQAQSALELIGYGLAMAAEDAQSYELAALLRSAAAAGQEATAAQASGWLALLERRVLSAPAAETGKPQALPAADPATAAAPDVSAALAKDDARTGQGNADEDDDDKPANAAAEPRQTKPPAAATSVANSAALLKPAAAEPAAAVVVTKAPPPAPGPPAGSSPTVTTSGLLPPAEARSESRPPTAPRPSTSPAVDGPAPAKGP